jgi:small subunit ribosomal protein S14
MGGMPNVRVLRDVSRRHGFASTEMLRRSYLFVARNTTLPANVRLQAQLRLTNLPSNTRPSVVKNRCTLTGKGRGVLSKWGLCRVSDSDIHRLVGRFV